MWTIYWNSESISVDNSREVFEIIDRLNLEYKKKTPIFVQVENSAGDRMCIGIGNNEEYSFINYFPFDGSSSKHVEGENEGNEVTCFYMGDYESEFYIDETIKYQTALNVLRAYVLNNILDKTVEWIED